MNLEDLQKIISYNFYVFLLLTDYLKEMFEMSNDSGKTQSGIDFHRHLARLRNKLVTNRSLSFVCSAIVLRIRKSWEYDSRNFKGTALNHGKIREDWPTKLKWLKATCSPAQYFNCVQRWELNICLLIPYINLEKRIKFPKLFGNT